MKIFAYPKFQAFDSNGDPLVGGLLYTYKEGTTTAKATYADQSGTANDNPVVLDSRGEATLYLSGNYKFVLKTAAGATIWTQDEIRNNDFNNIYNNIDNLADTVTAIGSDDATILIDTALSVTADLTIPTNVNIVKGGKLQIATGVTVTFGSQIEAGAYQIFELTGTGAVAFSKAVWAFPEWWGAKADDSTDSYAYFNQAINALTTYGGVLYLQSGAYRNSDTILLKSYVSLIGQHTGPALTGDSFPTKIHYIGTGAAIQCYTAGSPYDGAYNSITLSNIYVKDEGGTGNIGVYLRGFRWCNAENLATYGFKKGFWIQHSWYGNFRRLLASNYSDYGIYGPSYNNNCIFDHVKVGASDSGDIGMYFAYSDNLTINNMDLETDVDGAYFNECDALLLNGVYYEAPAGSSATYAICTVNCKGTTINSPFLNGSDLTNRGIYHTACYSTVVNGGRIVNFAANPVVDDSQGRELMLNNVYLNPDEWGNITNQGGCLRVGRRRIVCNSYDAPPVGGDWNIDDVAINAASSAGDPFAYVCTVAGTASTIATTGAIDSGDTDLTVADASDIRIGSYITIAGVSGIKLVTNIIGAVVTVTVASDATVTGAAVANSAPTFVVMGQIGYRSGAVAPAGNANFIGEEYLDSTAGKWYKAKAVGTGGSDWVALN